MTTPDTRATESLDTLPTPHYPPSRDFIHRVAGVLVNGFSRVGGELTFFLGFGRSTPT
jgi:hypothetical protein